MNKENKNNRLDKIKLILILSIIAIIFINLLIIFMYVNKKGVYKTKNNSGDNVLSDNDNKKVDKDKDNNLTENKEDNNLPKKLNGELEETMAFMVHDDLNHETIFALTKNGKEVKILDIEKEIYCVIDYTYENGSIYLHFNKYCANEEKEVSDYIGRFGKIDLTLGNGNYKINFYDETFNDEIKLINLNNDIYFTDGRLINRLDLNSQKIFDTHIVKNEEKENLWIDIEKISDTMIAYKSLGAIYLYDIKLRKNTLLKKDVDSMFVIEDKIIMVKSADEIGDKADIYEYDVTKKQERKIGRQLKTNAWPYSNIIGYNDYYIYYDSHGVYKYQNNKETEIYNMESIDYISLVSEDTLKIVKVINGHEGEKSNCVYLNLKDGSSKTTVEEKPIHGEQIRSNKYHIN